MEEKGLVLSSSSPSQHEMMVYQSMAQSAVESKMYKGIGDQAGIMMIMLAARELNIPPMQALNGSLNIINGKVEISARLMNGLMRRAGIRITIKESLDDRCTITATRPDGDTATASYTFAEAQKAGLVKPGGGWVKNPKDMCFARAISRVARQIAPDVIGGSYVEGEISGISAPTLIENENEVQAGLEEVISYLTGEEPWLIEKYIESVMGHFSWTKGRTIQEFLRDPVKLREKFAAWKSKNIKHSEKIHEITDACGLGDPVTP